jgi:MFS family permease
VKSPGSTLGSSLVLSAYWFSTSFKWFILLFVLLPDQVRRTIPGGEDGSTWGLIFSLGAAEAMIGPVVFGVLSDRMKGRWGRRIPFVVVGGLLTLVALGLLSQATTVTAMVLGYLLLQISDDIATAPYSALIPDLVKPEHRGYASGIMGFLQQFAQVCGAILVIVLGGSPMTVYAVIAAIQVIGVIITVVGVRERKDVVVTHQALSLQSWLAPWKIPDFRWVWFTRFLNAVGMYAITTYLVFYFDRVVKVFHLGPLKFDSVSAAQGFLILVISIVASLSAAFLGRITDRIGRKTIIVYSGVAMFAVLVPFALIPNYALIIGLSALFGVGYGAYIAADWALAADIMPNEEDFARDMGMWTMSIPLGQMFAGLFGVMLPFLGSISGGRSYQTLFLIAASLFLLSTVLIRMVRNAR